MRNDSHSGGFSLTFFRTQRIYFFPEMDSCGVEVLDFSLPAQTSRLFLDPFLDTPLHFHTIKGLFHLTPAPSM